MPAARITVLVLVALFVTLIPTTIGALLSAIGIAGMDRLVRFNVLAMSGRAVEAAGDVDTLLLDKTGTITLGNRQATEFLPLPGVTERELADAAQLASLVRRDAGRPLHRRAGQGEIRHPRPRHGAAQRAVHPLLRADAHERRRCRRHVDPQGRGRCGRSPCVGARQRRCAQPRQRRSTAHRRPHRQVRRHAARGRQGRPAARRHPSEGHRQGRHPRALRRAAQDGHPHRDDHRRQSADRRRHRRRSRRRRFPGPGDARDQARS